MAERELIPVERDEQINGLVRRLRQSPARQVAFAVPEEAPVLRNQVNLRLLQFYAEQEKKRLTLVTADVVVQRLAEEAGVQWSLPERSPAPVAAESPDETPVHLPGPAPAAGPTAARRFPLRPRLAHLLALPLLVLLIGSWQLLAGPAVTVTVRPAVEERSLEASLRGVTGTGTPDDVRLTLLQRPVSGSGSAPATGRRTFGVSRARGSVTFLNQETKAIRVAAGTVVTTAAGTAYRVTATVEVPAVKTEYFMKIAVGVRAGQAEARVEALEPGSSGNVAEGRVVRFRTPPAGNLQVTNPEPLKGGEDRSVAVVTAADVGRAEREAAAALARQARPLLEGVLEDGTALIPDSVRLSPPALSSGAHPGDEATQVGANATATAFGLTYRPEELTRLAGESFRKRLPAGLTLVPGSLSVAPPRFARVEPQLVEFIVPVSGRGAYRIDAAAVRRAVRGKSRTGAEAAVRALPGVGGVTIEGAVKRLPSWTGRLRVVVAGPSGEAL